MRPARFGLLTLLLLAVGAPAIEAASAKPKKPKLDVRAAPSMATAPVEVTVFISLRGGDELEEFYCPEIVCDWDDGAKSVQAPDCPPFEAGTPLTRHFTLGHLYRQGGYYAVRVQLRRGDRTIASGDATVRIQSGMSESR